LITASIRATPIVIPDEDNDDDDDDDNEENDEDDDSDRFDRMYGRRRHSRYSDSDGSVSGDPDAYYVVTESATIADAAVIGTPDVRIKQALNDALLAPYYSSFSIV